VSTNRGEVQNEQRRAQQELFKEQRLAHTVDIIMRFTTQWESQEIRRPRKEFCKRLINKLQMDDSRRQLLSFFETIGVIVKRAGIDPYIVWSEFC
jgi:hypothetical protein